MTQQHVCAEADTCIHRGLTRRRALAGTVLAGVGLPVLAACGGNSDGTATDPTTPDATTSASGTGSASAGSSTSAAAGDALASTSDIAEGGGTIFGDDDTVVTQPTAGVYKAFSATCTHTGCQVGTVSGGSIICPCHGSHYSILDGSVQSGPAPSPLPAKTVTVTGDQISVA